MIVRHQHRMASDKPPHPPDNPAPEEEFPPLRRSFPVPRRREAPVNEQPVARWQQWTLRGLIAVAVLMAGTAAWIRLRPDHTPPPAPPVAESEAPLSGPPDAALDIYFDLPLPEPAEPPPALTRIPPAESPPAPVRPLTGLDARYFGALAAAMKHIPEPDRAQFTSEIERLQTGAPLPPPHDGIHPELARLQSIYRLEFEKQRRP